MSVEMNTFAKPGFSRRVLIGAFTLLLCFAMACSSEESEKPTEEVDPNLPPAQVDLPSPPPASAFNIAETNQDGTLRVEGLIQYQDKHLDKPVRVKGVVTQILGDCDPKKAKKANTFCPEPHFIIKDESSAEKELMVVGFERDFFKKSKTKVGEAHVFEGDYRKMSQQFVNSESGLIALTKVDDISVRDED
ncbi:hypothetical protein [Bradymonas sediminis]|uniref:Uncharacterized protein n=1 Tax=Bradymonas sediminis TaxID=1548548 RepID=A0A2Z4FKT4_9DELT|nr:hypothetical protein [Bradymonas sediminis]AWV89415.1 hypothetical protein DN745_08720 [Bradymonas sediminis]TDP73597.1 hypothetical protein DFR33_106241 [Bradymonas sediminis]